ncbi:MAG: SBBP repeat-containing protein [Chloroflexia bacterium]
MLVRTSTRAISTCALPRYAILGLTLSAMLVWALPFSYGHLRLPTASGATHQSMPDLSKLPLAFEPVASGAGAPALYTVREPAATLLFSSSGVALSSSAGGVSLQFQGANSAAGPTQGAVLPGKANYLLGSDLAGWRTGVSTYSDITYPELYKGITLRYSGTQGLLSGTYTLSAGANPALLSWRYSGAGRVGTDAAGNLRIDVPSSRSTLMPAPAAWQDIAGKRTSVAAALVVAPDQTVSFALGPYDHAQPLNVQSTWAYSNAATQNSKLSTESLTLSFSSYLGGSQTDYGKSIAVDAQGYIYVTGYTQSANFPTSSPLRPSNGGGHDAFVTKFSPDGSTLVYSTYLGGSGNDEGRGIAVDAQGNAYVTGSTFSANFPVANALQPTAAGAEDIFVSKLNASGSGFVYSTYYGGRVNEHGEGLALDSAGNVYVAGVCDGGFFPVVNAYQPVMGGVEDSILLKLNAAGSAVVYATYLGGSVGSGGNYDHAFAIAVDGAGSPYLTGFTGSTDFPVVNAFQPTFPGNFDAYVTKFNPDGQSLAYSTYLGGSLSGEEAHGIAVDAAGSAYVTGWTYSNDFPTTPNSFQPINRGGGDAFITKFNPEGRTLAYSTFVGGTGFDYGKGIAVDASGAAYIVGQTGSTNFPMLNGIQTSMGGNSDAYVTKLNPSGANLGYSTYLGGTDYDDGYGIAVLGTTSYSTGYARSPNFPTSHPVQPDNAGAEDGFVSVITSDAPPTTTPLPTSTPTFTSTPLPTAPATNTPTSPSTHTPTNTPTNTPTAPASSSTSTPIATLTSTPIPCAIAFSDVRPDDYFYEPVRWLFCHGAISGYGDNTFRPGNLTTRGQLSKIVVLAEGWTISTPSAPSFRDVPADNPFYGYIETAYSRGIISGYSCGAGCLEFRPGNNVTRGQLAKIVVLAENWAINEPSVPTFRDVPQANAFYGYIEMAYSRGIISGYACGTGCLEFRSGNNATRGQISKIVYLAVTAPGR